MDNGNEDIGTNTLKAWVLAARPKTLSGAVVPVLIGVALAFKDAGWQGFHPLPAVLCFLFAILMQIDSNFINDYFDCVHGNDDTATRLGPKRACAEGWITLPVMRRGLLATSAVACLVGLPLIGYGGWEMVIVGGVCVAFAVLYTTFFSYRGLGDVLVLVFFGIIPVCFTYYVILPKSQQTITPEVLTIAIGCGLVIDTLLCINNFRDRHNDAHDGKMTLIVRLGEKRGARLYWWAGVLGASLTMAAIGGCGMKAGLPPMLATIPPLPLLAYLWLHTKSYHHLRQIWEGRALNSVLGMTARDMTAYGCMTALGIVLTIIL